jgi:hypothetical protein
MHKSLNYSTYVKIVLDSYQAYIVFIQTFLKNNTQIPYKMMTKKCQKTSCFFKNYGHCTCTHNIHVHFYLTQTLISMTGRR